MNFENIEKYQFTSDQSREKAAINGAKGGIASGKSRRRKKAYRDIQDRILSSGLTKMQRDQIETVTGKLDDDEATLYAAIFSVLINQALKGDVNAISKVLAAAVDIDDKAGASNDALERLDELMEAFNCAVEQEAD